MNVCFKLCQKRWIASTSQFAQNKKANVPKKNNFQPNKTVSKDQMYASYKVTSAREKSFDVKTKLDYLLVLDFEATCEENDKILPCQEIIEMPVIALDTTTWREKAKFHQYIKPTERPVLTSFCTHLTGIIQEMVDNQPTIDQTLSSFDEWLKTEEIAPMNFAFVTCGDWDLKVALPSEAAYKEIKLPNYFSNWINVKKSHSAYTGQFAKGLADLLNYYKIEHTGRLHSGIDDVQNISEIVKALGRSGYIFRVNSSISDIGLKQRLFKNKIAT